MPEIITVMKTVPSPIVAGRGVNNATTFTVVSPKPVPAIPPRLERINDSIRNCVDISSPVSYTHLTLPTTPYV